MILCFSLFALIPVNPPLAAPALPLPPPRGLSWPARPCRAHRSRRNVSAVHANLGTNVFFYFLSFLAFAYNFLEFAHLLLLFIDFVLFADFVYLFNLLNDVLKYLLLVLPFSIFRKFVYFLLCLHVRFIFLHYLGSFFVFF